MMLHIFTGLFNTFTFWHLGNSYIDMQSRLFSIFMTLTISPPLIQQLQPRYLHFRGIYESRESNSKIYSWLAFVVSTILPELPYSIVAGTVYFNCWYVSLRPMENAGCLQRAGTGGSGFHGTLSAQVIPGWCWCYLNASTLDSDNSSLPFPRMSFLHRCLFPHSSRLSFPSAVSLCRMLLCLTFGSRGCTGSRHSTTCLRVSWALSHIMFLSIVLSEKRHFSVRHLAWLVSNMPGHMRKSPAAMSVMLGMACVHFANTPQEINLWVILRHLFLCWLATDQDGTRQAASFNVFYSYKWRDYVSSGLLLYFLAPSDNFKTGNILGFRHFQLHPSFCLLLAIPSWSSRSKAMA